MGRYLAAAAGVSAILVAIITGAVAFADLRADVRVLQDRLDAAAPVESIERATREALQQVRAAGEAFLAFEPPERFGAQGTGQRPLIEVGTGLCYLMGVAGDFNGNGEYARIREVDGIWEFQTRSRAGGGARIIAQAACWRFPTAEPMSPDTDPAP